MIPVGMRVFVYRNLHKDLWSLRERGRVIGHAETVVLLDAEFRVGAKGRQRAVRERRRNVHAFVAGRREHTDTVGLRGALRIRYNPFRSAHFTDPKERAVAGAARVIMLPDGRVYAFNVTYV